MAINDILDKFITLEKALVGTRWVAPCVAGGRIRVKIAGLVYTFIVQPPNFSGWGVFQAIDAKQAQLIESANFVQIAQYLEKLPLLRLYLVEQLKETKIWLSTPFNATEAYQRFHVDTPIPLHLVTEGARFDAVIASSDGHTFWFERIDRRADPKIAEQLRQALQTILSPEDLRIPKLTPALHTAYQLAYHTTTSHRVEKYAEQRLRSALAMGGGELYTFQDRGNTWQVEWKTSGGTLHTSTIAKSDLTVISAGLCLEDRDQDFDLQSLVGVVEEQFY